MWLAALAQDVPDFAAVWLPGAVLLGIGIGLASPALATAALGAVPSSRFAEGSGINAMMRQMGAVLGVATVVTVVGTPAAAADAARAFHGTWLALAGCGAACAVLSFALARSGLRAVVVQPEGGR